MTCLLSAVRPSCGTDCSHRRSLPVSAPGFCIGSDQRWNTDGQLLRLLPIVALGNISQLSRKRPFVRYKRQP